MANEKFKMPFCPAQAGYAADFGDGTLRVQLDGGSGRYRAGVMANSDTVTATWVLQGEEYSAFMGFVRNQRRSGGVPFLIDLPLESHELVEYEANFVPRSVRLVSKTASVFTVAASLEVLSKLEFDDIDLDYWASLVMMLAIYGSIPAAREILNLLAKLVNEDLPHA
ncbi:hypothetical protein [Achromobacter insolitus]|uniref:hypothetical protein n=1 Tax=Achromobacter insolitus TaxID=217204 RepID=UPI0020A33298|nr:hypothetical protein [Achromobacter insolitus]MCP1404245.1 hypothetical protein [Achromobacter insolitus]